VKNKTLILAIVSVIIVVVCIMGGGYVMINESKPECYLAEEDICMGGYDKTSLQYPIEEGFNHECCRRPHYILQGLEGRLVKHWDGINKLLNSSEVRT